MPDENESQYGDEEQSPQLSRKMVQDPSMVDIGSMQKIESDYDGYSYGDTQHKESNTKLHQSNSRK